MAKQLENLIEKKIPSNAKNASFLPFFEPQSTVEPNSSFSKIPAPVASSAPISGNKASSSKNRLNTCYSNAILYATRQPETAASILTETTSLNTTDLKKACKAQVLLIQILNKIETSKKQSSSSKPPAPKQEQIKSQLNNIPQVKWTSKKLLLTRISSKMAISRCLLQYSFHQDTAFIKSLLFEVWCDYFGFNLIELATIQSRTEFSYHAIASACKTLAQNCARKFKDDQDFNDAVSLSEEIAGYLFFIDTSESEQWTFYDFWRTYPLEPPGNEQPETKPNHTSHQLSACSSSSSNRLISSGKLISIYIYNTITNLVILRGSVDSLPPKQIRLYNAYKYSSSFRNWMECGFATIKANNDRSTCEIVFLELLVELLLAEDLVRAKNLITITNLIKNGFQSKSLFTFLDTFVGSLVSSDFQFLQFRAASEWISLYSSLMENKDINSHQTLSPLLIQLNSSVLRIADRFTVFTF